MIDKIGNILRDKRRRKPYVVALILAVLFVWEIFFLSPFLGEHLGLLGTELHEMILAGMGIGVFVTFHGKMKVIFPFESPKWDRTLGTILMWIGAYQIMMVISYLMSMLFPQEVTQASESVNSLIDLLPVWLGLFVVAFTPAICEEIAFRGALLSCFRHLENRWIGIVLVSLLFGACHGSIWRMIPTAILGMFMAYILLETDNMFYNMLFHLINNGVPVILMGITRFLDSFVGMENGLDSAISAEYYRRIMAEGLASGMKTAALAPFLIYIGNYFLHRGNDDYRDGIFPAEKEKTLTVMIAISVCLWISGTLLKFVLSLV